VTSRGLCGYSERNVVVESNTRVWYVRKRFLTVAGIFLYRSTDIFLNIVKTSAALNYELLNANIFPNVNTNFAGCTEQGGRGRGGFVIFGSSLLIKRTVGEIGKTRRSRRSDLPPGN